MQPHLTQFCAIRPGATVGPQVLTSDCQRARPLVYACYWQQVLDILLLDIEADFALTVEFERDVARGARP